MSDQNNERPDFVPAGPEPTYGQPSKGQSTAGSSRSPSSMSTPTLPTEVPAPQSLAPVQRPPRRNRWVLVVCGVLAGLLVLFVVADRVAVRVAGNELASTLQSSLGTSEPPEVSFGGFPFLTQLATSHYSSVEMTARDVSVTAAGQPLLIDQVQATLTDVDAARDGSSLEAGEVDARAGIGYPALSELVGRPVAYDSTRDGKVRIRIDITDSIVVSGAPTFDASTQKLSLSDTEFRLGEQTIPASGLDSVLQELLGITFPELVPGVLVTDVRAGEQDLNLTWSGTDVSIQR
jgi:hypothetical protein